MKKRSSHPRCSSITNNNVDSSATTAAAAASPSPSSPSSSTSSSSSTSCVVDSLNHHHNVKEPIVNCSNNIVHEVEKEEEEKPPKAKRTRRKKGSINAKTTEKCPNNNNNTNVVNPPTTNRRSSIYRGVTRHRWTGRFEAHLWDKSSWNNIQNKKGRQVYLGAYDSEVDAARTYDLAALKYWGPETTLNFPIENYTKELEEMQNATKEEYLASLRRRSSGFSRGVSKYRGVARHHHNGRWEARIGRVFGNKYLYLGTFSSQEEAAAAYDLAAIEYRGANAVTNFDISNYIGRVKNLMPKCQSQQPLLNQTKAMEQPQRKQQQMKQHKEEEQEEKQDQPATVIIQRALPEVEQQDQKQTALSSQLEESKLINSIDHLSSMLRMDCAEDEKENPWSFCLDAGGYDPLLVPDIPFEEDGSLLDLFEQTSFEDNIDMIFEENLISMDDTFFGGTEVIGCQTRIKTSEDWDKKIENYPKAEDISLSFSSSSPSSPSSITSLVSCQL